MNGPSAAPKPKPEPRKFRPPVGPKLKKVLALIFALLVLLIVNSVYLTTITIAGAAYQDYFYQWMFLLHLVLGLAIILPVIIFGAVHIRNTFNRPNRRAVRAGFALLTCSIILLVSGIVLTRMFINLEGTGRSIAYWAHVITPVLVIWLYILHRLAGRRIKWKTGLTWAGVAAGFAIAMLIVQAQDPRAWNVAGPEAGEQYFFPSLARTSTGNFIPANVLDNDEFCMECHPDIYDSWSHSVHRFSSFNNPPYLFSVKQTRQAMMERDGNVHGSRFCAGCHDPVPFFSGAFDDPKFDDPNYDLASDPTAQAGITCTTCHAIVHVGNTTDGETTLGNADYTIEEPIHYPFTFSENPVLKWVNRQLIKAKPEFHKKTFLKPLHQSTQFCGTCHKVHLPPELNDYKWLRGQNHYDAFWLSGVSGYGITSFYYPPKAQSNCNGCHMPLMASNDFGARRTFDDSGDLKVHDHMFPTANTAIPQLVKDDVRDYEGAIRKHQEFLDGVIRVDIFGLREGGAIDGDLIGPVRTAENDVPALEPGRTYLIESIIRTVKMGHVFTQGTADSNEVWMDVAVTSGGETIGRSGGRDDENNAVDPWSHYVNAFVIDREGNRINRRNAQDIFIALYNNQIPPGAADVVHYLLEVPEDARESITVDVKLQFRKFDTEYMQMVMDDPESPGLDPYYNDLTITTLAHDRVTFPIAGSSRDVDNAPSEIPLWQRWNDYGIALFRRGQLRQAEEAFATVEELGYPDGPVNLARVYLAEGLVDEEAPAALRRARDFADTHGEDRAAREWSVLWFGGLVDKQNGNLDEAIRKFRQIVEGGFRQAQGRSFNFARDYRVLIELADTLYQNSLRERGDDRKAKREELMRDAESFFQQALVYDPENAAAHYGLNRVYLDLGDDRNAEHHATLHAKYKLDDNARDQAIAAARMKYPAANHAAERVVIYDLARDGAYELADSGERTDDASDRPSDRPPDRPPDRQEEELVHHDGSE